MCLSALPTGEFESVVFTFAYLKCEEKFCTISLLQSKIEESSLFTCNIRLPLDATQASSYSLTHTKNSLTELPSSSLTQRLTREENGEDAV